MPRRRITPMTEGRLSPRYWSILSTIIEEHVRSGEPVGSRSIARVSTLGLSPATIRNIMSDLEELGLLSKPHSSSGREPTGEAYRLYVEELVSQKKMLPSRETIPLAGLSLEKKLDSLIRGLARQTHCVAFTLGPRVGSLTFEHIELVRVAPQRVLVLIVSRSGILHQQVVETETDYSVDQLRSMSTFLQSHFQGKSLGEVRQELTRLSYLDKAAFDKRFQEAMDLAQQTLEHDMESEFLLVEGSHNMLEHFGQEHLPKMRSLLEALEEKKRILDLLTTLLSGEGLQVVFDPLKPEGGLPLSLMFLPILHPGGLRSGLGILGPTRMNYPQVLGQLMSAGRQLGPLLAGRGTDPQNRIEMP